MVAVNGWDGFELPPVVHNAHGRVRTVGYELEYSGVSIARSAEIIREVFGGEVRARSTFECEVETGVGRFSVEIDTLFLKDRKYESILRSLGVEPDRHDTGWIERALLGVLSAVVPIEVVGPPMAVTEMGAVEVLRQRLFEERAKGTRAALFYAFGMHINPEVPSMEPGVLLDHLRAFVLLYPELRRRREVDVARAVTPYIDPFPAEYGRLILAEDYAPDARGLVTDYLTYNPTRNRALDMLPVLASFDEGLVRAKVTDDKVARPRPTFHYRLPNCMVDEAVWRIRDEWNAWVGVERLAADRDRLMGMAREYLAAGDEKEKEYHGKWNAVIESVVGA